MVNQAVGDALSGILLVEAALRLRSWTLQDWAGLYQDLPSCMLKVRLPGQPAWHKLPKLCISLHGQVSVEHLVFRMQAKVPDRSLFTTADAETRCVTPAGLQPRIDALLQNFSEGETCRTQVMRVRPGLLMRSDSHNAVPVGRAFVRPSGTEDVVRVYAEAATQAQADTLARTVATFVQEQA